MKTRYAFLVTWVLLVILYALPVGSYTRTPRTWDGKVSGGAPLLGSDRKLIAPQVPCTQRTTAGGQVTTECPGDTIVETSGPVLTATASLTFSGVRSSTITTTSTVTSTATNTNTVTNTNTNTVTNTTTSSVTSTITQTHTTTSTVTGTGTGTGSDSGAVSPAETATVTVTATRPASWTKTGTYEAYSTGSESYTYVTTDVLGCAGSSFFGCYPPYSSTASATSSATRTSTITGTGTATGTDTGTGTIAGTGTGTGTGTATQINNNLNIADVEPSQTNTETFFATSTGTATATVTESASSTASITLTTTVAITNYSVTATGSGSGTWTATHTFTATATLNGTTSTGTATGTVTGTRTQTGTQTGTATTTDTQSNTFTGTTCNLSTDACVIGQTGGGVQLAELSTTFSNDSETLEDVTELTVNVVAGQVYHLRAYLPATTEANEGSDAGYKVRLGGTATFTRSGMAVIFQSGGYTDLFGNRNPSSVNWLNSSTIGTTYVTGGTARGMWTFDGTVVPATSGTIVVQWAADTYLDGEHPTEPAILAGAYLEVLSQ